MFSVLMSVYKNENANHFRAAIESIIDQSLPPSEIVLVKDGPLTAALDGVIENSIQRHSQLFKVITLERNQGLGEALRIGLLECKYELIARMDSDDVSDHFRFEKQIAFFKAYPEIDVLGGSIAEFDLDPNNISAYRFLPTTSDDLNIFAKTRSPINHVTAMFKKSSVLDAGNYVSFLGLEDYHLWARMLKKGMVFRNLPDVLVKVRGGIQMVKRRGGMKYLKNEWLLQSEFLKIKFISYPTFLYNVIARTIVRILPAHLRMKLYMFLLRD